MATTTEPPTTLSAAEQARRNLRLSTRWTRFGRLLVEQLLAEHDAAVQRAETAERALAEMRDEWGVRRTWSDGAEDRTGYAICETEEHARVALEHYRATDRFERSPVENAVVKRVVGEWKAADGG